MNKEKKFQDISSEEKARIVAQWLDEKQGEDVIVLDVSKISSVTDMTIIVSARGVKHAKALAENILQRSAEEKLEFLSMEGHKTGEWVLVDLNDVLVHIFLVELRDFYNIEGMWSEALTIDI
nr:ribosome silencing factor [Pseudodesulfovibrio sediminis]